MLAGAVIGVGYWQYTRQADLLGGFEYIAWNSDYQRQIDTVKDGEGRDFKVMKLARRYDDHWLVGNAYPDGYVGKVGKKTNSFAVSICWMWCVGRFEIDTGEEYMSGDAMPECVDGDKLFLSVAFSATEHQARGPSQTTTNTMASRRTDMKYWPWGEAGVRNAPEGCKRLSQIVTRLTTLIHGGGICICFLSSPQELCLQSVQ